MHTKLNGTHGFSMILASSDENKFINFIPMQGGNYIRSQDGLTVNISIPAEGLAQIRDILNDLDLPLSPPKWNDIPVTDLDQLLELSDYVGEDGGDAFLQLVRDFREYRQSLTDRN